MSDDKPVQTRLWRIAPQGRYQLAVHGGAGGRIHELADQERHAFEDGLSRAYAAGETVLADGGTATDAVCAAICVLEDDPLFNAGRGASLAADGSAELDAAIMDGAGHAGAVAASRHARNPVRLARQVMRRSPHVLIAAPDVELINSWGEQTADQRYFVTDSRRRQLAHLHADDADGPRHGTVGAVARDSTGGLAAATSTGGIANQSVGRVGDTPIIGAGTYARNGLAAISCTGHGEAFMLCVVSYDIVARLRYLGVDLADAVSATIETELSGKDSSGGLVAVGADGTVVVAHNSPMMFAAFDQDHRLVTLT
ncbi:isoaspartyl dipeptidase with L-asparaginase activity [Microlunatus elymi]|uniref:Isoaspartyl dipeptidase with L-asparaginase activity n=1 Tax=Microlunatus elymi TaxID=2596828 RepID=A0A516Q141_9ACTN|nr:isoaspartyl peptidase/L-asparaginase [Microlunatus elymi]QDP97137.1 isoaspartyl dipeptidase with L-asparaginase activity [Microlunatus elymi]